MSNSSNPALGVLVIIPIVIALSAAYIALKTNSGFHFIANHYRRIWDKRPSWSYPRDSQRSKHTSSLASSQTFADSWCDLESVHSVSKKYSRFVGQYPSCKSPSEEDKRTSPIHTPRRIWHPTRSARLTWSFTNPRSSNRHPFELSNVAKPSRVSNFTPPFGSVFVFLRRESPNYSRDLRKYCPSATTEYTTIILTILSGSAASGETLCRGRRLSDSSGKSRGSPPPAINRSLTVRKLRKGKSSVMGRNFDGPPGPSGTNARSIIADVVRKENGEVPRTFYASALSVIVKLRNIL